MRFAGNECEHIIGEGDQAASEYTGPVCVGTEKVKRGNDKNGKNDLLEREHFADQHIWHRWHTKATAELHHQKHSNWHIADFADDSCVFDFIVIEWDDTAGKVFVAIVAWKNMRRIVFREKFGTKRMEVCVWGNTSWKQKFLLFYLIFFRKFVFLIHT